ncbi:hypothetical protein C1H76_2696 [Elsinoe australis]|uniref:Uncharacterized protein n=1 Tax=Elsinoe australis TaxID=40998 RepID=A0A4U7B6U6_9PEZI|nr:hypothetical protein C1H76_2696 [Elsinoe australis]
MEALPCWRRQTVSDKKSRAGADDDPGHFSDTGLDLCDNDFDLHNNLDLCANDDLELFADDDDLDFCADYDLDLRANDDVDLDLCADDNLDLFAAAADLDLSVVDNEFDLFTDDNLDLYDDGHLDVFTGNYLSLFPDDNPFANDNLHTNEQGPH